MKALTLTFSIAFGLLVLFGAWLAMLALPAAAATCADRDIVLISLAENYAERQSGLGLAANDAVVELFTAETGSWTLLVSYPNGHSCVIASGEAWVAVTAVKPGTEG